VKPLNKPCADACEVLNRRWGAPGRIVFRPSESGSPVVALANQYGSCEVQLYGAQVLSYRPTGNMPVLFQPESMRFDTDEEVHGGIPVCWPWFGATGPEGSVKHGLARYCHWRVSASEYSEDMTEITLALASDAATRAVWPHDFTLAYKITLSQKLTLSLEAKNTGAEPFRVTEGFHPYLRVRAAAATSVLGVNGCDYVYNREEGMPVHTNVGDVPVDFAGSKIYTFPVGKPLNEAALLDPGLRRAIAIVSRGAAKLVVWNPGAIRPGEFENLLPEETTRFVCVEPATLFRDAGYDLAPGAVHVLQCAIQSVPDDGSVHARG